MGRTRSDLKEFPDRVQRAVGHELLSGFGSGKVWELRENDSSGTYRAVYTVEFKEFVAVLHVFQKKSKSGMATPKYEIEIIEQRLKDARMLYQRSQGKIGR